MYSGPGIAASPGATPQFGAEGSTVLNVLASLTTEKLYQLIMKPKPRRGRPARAATTTVDKRLRKLMRNAGIVTFDELAEALELDVSTLYLYRVGHRKPSMKSILALARTLEVSTDDIIAAFS